MLFGVEGADRTQLRLVLAHEMIHALQGQYLPLDSILEPATNNDRLTAAQAILEGQATLASLEVLAPGQGVAHEPPVLGAVPGAGAAAAGGDAGVRAGAAGGAGGADLSLSRGRGVHALVGDRRPTTRCRTARGCRSRPSRSSTPSATSGATSRCRSPSRRIGVALRGRARRERDPGAARHAGGVGRSADGGADRLGRRPLPGLRHAGRARRWCGTWCGTTSARRSGSPECRGAAAAHVASRGIGRRSTRSRRRGGRRRGTCWRPTGGSGGGGCRIASVKRKGERNRASGRTAITRSSTLHWSPFTLSRQCRRSPPTWIPCRGSAPPARRPACR